MPLALAAVEYGAGPPLAILHGLFGSGRNWTSIAQGLAPQHRVTALDLRNHGVSPWAETMGYGEMAEDVRTSLSARGYEHYALLGHSMGGKVAMMAALQHPEMVERLIVADIAPVSYPMRHLYEVEAMRRAGGRSGYVQPAYEPAIRRFLPKHEIPRIEKAGHWLHAEQPAEFLAIVERFLSR